MGYSEFELRTGRGDPTGNRLRNLHKRLKTLLVNYGQQQENTLSQMAKGNSVKRDVVNIENWLFVIYAALIFIYQFINLQWAAETQPQQQQQQRNNKLAMPLAIRRTFFFVYE